MKMSLLQRKLDFGKSRVVPEKEMHLRSGACNENHSGLHCWTRNGLDIVYTGGQSVQPEFSEAEFRLVHRVGLIPLGDLKTATGNVAVVQMVQGAADEWESGGFSST